MALAEIYVDPSIAADSGTGTSGDPYGDLQYAIDNITLGANGTRVNVKAGTAEVLTKALDLTTGFTGTISATAPLVIQGYTTTAGDGGEAELDCTTNSVQFMNDTNTAAGPIALIDLYIHSDVAYVILVNYQRHILRTRIVGTDGVVDIEGGSVIGCYIESTGGVGSSQYLLRSSTTGNFSACANYLKAGTTIRYGISSINLMAFFNILDSSASTQTSYNGMQGAQNGVIMAHNTVKGKSSGTGNELIKSVYSGIVVLNNYVEGSSGNGYASSSVPDYPCSAFYNSAYNNSTDFTLHYTDDTIGAYPVGNQVCTASGVTNLATSNFIPTGETIDAAFPQEYIGLTAFDSMPDAGAVQSQPPTEADASSQSSVTSLSSLSSSSLSSLSTSSSTSSQTLSTSSSSSSGNARQYRMNVFLFIPTQQ